MQVKCAQCGGAIPLERDDAFLRCPFCASTLFLDRAATFIHMELVPALGETRARDLLAQELRRREIPEQPVRSVEKLKLPFWAVREAEALTTQAAFSPLPAALAEFRIPASGASVVQEGPGGEFRPVACAETASARWDPGNLPKGLALFAVPFYRIAFGAKGSRECEAWVEATTGGLWLGDTPPADTAQISRLSMAALVGLFLVVVLESALIPNAALGLVVALVTVVAAYPLLRRWLHPLERP